LAYFRGFFFSYIWVQGANVLSIKLSRFVVFVRRPCIPTHDEITHIRTPANPFPPDNENIIPITRAWNMVMKLALPPLWWIHFKPAPIFSKIIANNCKLVFRICKFSVRSQTKKMIWGANFMQPPPHFVRSVINQRQYLAN